MRAFFAKRICFLIPVIILFSGCASIVSKNKYPLNIRSTPKSANVTVVNKKGIEVFSGITPADIILKSKNGFFSNARYKVKISMDGYTTKEIIVSAKLNGWYFGNIFFGGVIGMLIVDPLTGAMWKISERAVYASLEQVGATSVTPALTIIDIKDVPETMKKDLIRLN